MKKYNKTIALCALSLLFIASCAPSNSNSLTIPTVDSSAVEISKSDAKIIFDACKDAYFAREKLDNEYKIGNNARIEHEYYGYHEYIETTLNTKSIQERKDTVNFEFSFQDKYLNLVENHYDKAVSVNKNGKENTYYEFSATTNASIYDVDDEIHYIYEYNDIYFPENNKNINETYSYKHNFERFHLQYLAGFHPNYSIYDNTLYFFSNLNYFNEYNALLFELNEKYYSKGEGSLIVEVTYKEGENWTTREYYEFNNYLCVLYAYSSLHIEDYGEFSDTGITKFEYDNVVPKF